MTTKEIAEAAGVSSETVRAKGKELFPLKFEAGKKTVFSQKEAIAVMSELRKKGFIQPTENLEEPAKNLEVDRIDRLERMVEKLCIAVATIPQTIQAISGNQKQIAFVQDYFSIKGYASKLGQRINFSDAISLGRVAGKLSRDREVEIRKIDDESYGQVNSYHISILEEVFQI